MRLFLRWLVVCVLTAIVTTGCSTPGKRARQHPAMFNRLPPADQKLVLHGRVRPGLSQEGVYLAWGKPDAQTTGDTNKDGLATETWIYWQRITLFQPQNSYEYFGPYQEYDGSSVEHSLQPDYFSGRLGYGGLLLAHPQVRSMDTWRVAEFTAGKVDRYKMAHGTWSAYAIDPMTPPALTYPAEPDNLHTVTANGPGSSTAHNKKPFGVQRCHHRNSHLRSRAAVAPRKM